jgi:chromosome segregation ATPase
LRANRALMSSSIKDTLTLLLKSEDIVAIDDAIKKYAGTEGPLAETYKELEKRRETLQKEMEKKLTDAAKLETPMEITQVLEEGAKYGDSLETQIQALRDHQQQLLTDANSKLGELASSEDFAEVDAGVSK